MEDCTSYSGGQLAQVGSFKSLGHRVHLRRILFEELPKDDYYAWEMKSIADDGVRLGYAVRRVSVTGKVLEERGWQAVQSALLLWRRLPPLTSLPKEAVRFVCRRWEASMVFLKPADCFLGGRLAMVPRMGELRAGCVDSPSTLLRDNLHGANGIFVTGLL